jgi:hypothetical protein
MGHSPAAPADGTYRVIRLHSVVVETIVTAADVPSAKAAAKLLKPAAWQERRVYQFADEDTFEYDVVAALSDDGTT